MFKIKFDLLCEIRMGSPYNSATISIDGEYVPELKGFTFQDKYALSADLETCVLVQWNIIKNEPGFIIWKIREKERSVQKSERIEGCCHEVKLQNNKVEVTYGNYDRASKAFVYKNQLLEFK